MRYVKSHPGGLIRKVAVTAANVWDASGLKHVSPRRCVVYEDNPGKATAY